MQEGDPAEGEEAAPAPHNYVLVFALAEDHTPEQLRAAYEVLAKYGFRRVQGDAPLPPMTVIGPWFRHEPPGRIRDAMALALGSAEIEIPITHMLVADFIDCTWFGPRLDQN